MALGIYLLFRWEFARTTRSVGEQLQAIEGRLLGCRDFTNYLPGKERATRLKELNSLASSLSLLGKYQVLFGKRQRDLIAGYTGRIESLKAFLARFVSEFARKEIERSKDFFEHRPFDKDQLEAIVKRENRSLVLASAGSGKTRTLTARVAYTVRQGAEPRDILALAYTRSAEEEMRNRLRGEYGIADTNVRTFHSLGREIAKLSPNFRTGVADNQQELVGKACDRLRADKGFARLLLDFALELQTSDVDEKEFISREKYYEFLRAQRHVTLSGRQVKSLGERDIANFLFLNQVKFEYESPATWADKNVNYRTYEPDFYLPEYGLWIEHWAIDRQGNVPAWFSSNQSLDPSTRYRQGMQWKRYQFQKHGRRLIETYNHQQSDGTLVPELAQRLQENKVRMKELTTEEILAKVETLIHHRDALNELMFSFISKAKTNGLTPGSIVARLNQFKWSRKQRVFASLMIRVWEEYESILKERDMIDFNDMINYALQVAKGSPSLFANKYSHILIDEYQDITDPQLELIICLLNANVRSTLFCVGDDRQNIFSFAGSNIYNILRFGQRFPDAENTILSTNYRCPTNIVEASNFIASLNKFKIEKSVVPSSKVQHPIRLVEQPGNDRRSYDDWQHEKAKQLILDLAQHKDPREEIMVLSRFNWPLRRLQLEFPQNETLRIRFLSIHKAKGTEANYVLLLSCIRGRNGFPSEILDRRVLDIVENARQDEAGKLEEERRLFYVALTRCKKELYLFSSSSQRSRFIFEAQPYLSPWTEPNTKLVPT